MPIENEKLTSGLFEDAQQVSDAIEGLAKSKGGRSHLGAKTTKLGLNGNPLLQGASRQAGRQVKRGAKHWRRDAGHEQALIDAESYE